MYIYTYLQYCFKICVCHTADETLEKYKNNVNCLRQYVV